MSDYYTEVGISRDKLAQLLSENMEQAPYVLAEFAEIVSPGMADFDDFIDQLETLNGNQKANLLNFTQRVADSLAG